MNELKVSIFLPDRILNDPVDQTVRHKRQIPRSNDNLPSNSGNQPIVYDRAYGVDLDLKVTQFNILKLLEFKISDVLGLHQY